MANRLKKIMDLVDRDLGTAVTGVEPIEWFVPLRERLDETHRRHQIAANGFKQNAEDYRELGLLDEAETASLAEMQARRVILRVEQVTHDKEQPERLASFELYVAEVREQSAMGGCFQHITDKFLRLCLREYLSGLPTQRVSDYLIHSGGEG